MFGIVVGISLIASVAGAEPPSTHPPEPPKIDVEARYVPEWLYELEQDEDLYRLAKCESSLNEKAFNPADRDGEPKYGLLQYDADTWIAFQIEMGIDPTLNIYSGADQYRVTKWAFANGKQSHWGICL